MSIIVTMSWQHEVWIIWLDSSFAHSFIVTFNNSLVYVAWDLQVCRCWLLRLLSAVPQVLFKNVPTTLHCSMQKMWRIHTYATCREAACLKNTSRQWVNIKNTAERHTTPSRSKWSKRTSAASYGEVPRVLFKYTPLCFLPFTLDYYSVILRYYTLAMRFIIAH